MAITYSELKAALRQDDLAGDPWGTAMGALFDVADTLHFDRDADVPANWHYHPSILGPTDPDEQTYIGQCLLPDTSTGEILRFGNLLNRYADRLRHAGKDY